MLGRIDNDGNYEPGNCKWSTPEFEANNKSSNHKIEIGGVVKNLSQWARIYGIKVQIVTCRIWRGWTPQEAVTRPLRKRTTISTERDLYVNK